jgi:hypothetical protein|tara:strand:- start:462 stop:608 length:147 start_codon:yes stop_codon:yes gene_type:complete
LITPPLGLFLKNQKYDENQDLIESDEIENKVKTTDDFFYLYVNLKLHK